MAAHALGLVVMSLDAQVATGPYLVAAGVLAVAGVAKVRSPGGASRALDAVGLPAPSVAVRLLGAIELGLAIGCITSPSTTMAILLAGAFGVFAVFVGYLLVRRIEVPTCGCFGERDTPPSVVHVVFNVGAAGAALLAVAATPASLGGLLTELPLAGAPFVLGVIVAVYLSWLVVVELPAAISAWRPSHG